MTTRSVQDLFAEAMKAHALRKKALNWFCDGNSIVSGINLQASAWNGRKAWGAHYVNAGCFIRELDVAQKYAGKLPPTFSFHIQFRAGNLLPGEYADRLRCLDDELSMQEDQRFEAIKVLIDQRLVPITRQLATEHGVIEAYRNSQLPSHCFQGLRLQTWLTARA